MLLFVSALRMTKIFIINGMLYFLHILKPLEVYKEHFV